MFISWCYAMFALVSCSCIFINYVTNLILFVAAMIMIMSSIYVNINSQTSSGEEPMTS